MKALPVEVSWHAQQPVLALDFHESGRLATAGADADVKMWRVLPGRAAAVAAGTGSGAGDAAESVVEFLASLSRHEKTVNVVRFAPDGRLLASGSDDFSILLWRLSATRDPTPASADKECWSAVSILRGHVMDVYDLAWSPDAAFIVSGSTDNTAIVWDARAGKAIEHLRRHTGYVQGVAWDPRGDVLSTQSCDRSLRHFAAPRAANANATAVREVAVASSMEGGVSFLDDTAPGFFRRLAWTPDGALLIVPGAAHSRSTLSDGIAEAAPTTMVFARQDLQHPAVHLPGPEKNVVAVRVSPVLYAPRPGASAARAEPLCALPYRMMFAVASLDTVYVYDTAQTVPVAVVRGLHYADLTDLAWSSDGRILATSSADGYCSLVLFAQGELGEPLSHAATLAALAKQPAPAPGSADAAAAAGASDAPVSVLQARRASPSKASPSEDAPVSILKVRRVAPTVVSPAKVAVCVQENDRDEGADSPRVKRVRFDDPDMHDVEDSVPSASLESGKRRVPLSSTVSGNSKLAKRIKARAVKVQEANAALNAQDAILVE